MNFIFIGSYLNVPYAIDAIEREGGEFRILTANQQLRNLFSELYSPDVVIELPSLFASFGDFGLFCADLIRLYSYKRDYLALCRRMRPRTIVFFHIVWNGFESWLIKQLSKNSSVYYRPEVSVDHLQVNNAPKQLIKVAIARLLFFIPFKSVMSYGYPRIVIDKKFLKSVNAKPYQVNADPRVIRTFMERTLVEFNSIKVLFVIGGELNLDASEYAKILSLVYAKLTAVYKPQEIGIKQHPDNPDRDMAWAKSCVVIPKHLPANLLCYQSSVVVSYASAVLYQAAEAGAIAISLIYLIRSEKERGAVDYQRYLMDNSRNKNIAFPKSMEELEATLSHCQ